MKIQIINLLVIIVFAVSCNTSHNDQKDNGDKNVLTDEESRINQSKSVDTIAIMEIVTEDILNRLKGQQIRKSDFDEKGDYYIEFHEDTTNAKPDDIIWEYYLIEKNEIITGKLNSDSILDFAIRSTSGATIGNMFGLEWHVYVSDGGKYKRIQNDFGGGKFSDMETVTRIDTKKLTTKFQELDEETAWLKDSVVFRVYNIEGSELKRIK